LTTAWVVNATHVRSGAHRRSRQRAALAAAALAAALSLTACGSSSHAITTQAALRPIGAGLRGPAGLKATVYASGLPTVATLTFDSRGRLWAAAAGLQDHRRDGVYLIARPGAKPERMIAGLDDPLGLLWEDGTLYVASVGRVDAFSGLRGGRFTRDREIVVGPVAHAENNDLVAAAGGRLLLGITATCDHCTPKSPYSGSIVSFRTDGRGLRLYAARIRAPVGLTYYPGTTDLFVTMNQRDDLGARTPGDWLAVVRQGQSWGFPQCYGQGGAACAGVPKPVAALDPHAAVGSVVIVAATPSSRESGSAAGSPTAVATSKLGPAVGAPTALVAQWAVPKVQKVALTRVGSTYRGSVTPFLTGLQNPLALVLAPDHSLLVGDWGTGRIYRIAAAS
jgi:glucose/arabinose dehydrogenase